MTIVFSKASWHKKLVTYVYGKHWTEENRHKNLCPYVRGVIKAALGLPAVFIWKRFPENIQWQYTDWAKVLFKISLIPTFFHILLWQLHPEFQWWWIPAYVGGIIGAYLGTVGLFALGSIINDRIESRASPYKGPGLIKSYIESKHSKVCPDIKFE